MEAEPEREGKRNAMADGGRGGRKTRSAGEAQQGAASPPPPRRRSKRLTAQSPEEPPSEAGTEPPASLGARHITLRKIQPRNRRQQQISPQKEKENIVPEAVGDAGTEQEPFPLPRSSSAGRPQVLSPVSINIQESPTGDERDLAMAKRVRRSYSRLEAPFAGSFLESSRSPSSNPAGTSTPDKRHTFFGFEELLLSDEVAGASPRNAGAPLKAAETARDPNLLLELDTNIPGIVFYKEKRRKKKRPKFDKPKLDPVTAQLMVQIEEAEKFELVVE